MDIEDANLSEQELEILSKFKAQDVYPVILKIVLPEMDQIREESVFAVGDDPHGAGLRQGRFTVLSNILSLADDAKKKLQEMAAETK